MSQSVSGETLGEPSTSQRVIEAVAETTGDDLTEVGPLYHTIDPDALDRLFSPTRGGTRTGGYVEFEFAGCQVVVRGDGEVDVTEREMAPRLADENGNENDTACAGTHDRV
jgi:arginase family enzyme